MYYNGVNFKDYVVVVEVTMAYNLFHKSNTSFVPGIAHNNIELRVGLVKRINWDISLGQT